MKAELRALICCATLLATSVAHGAAPESIFAADWEVAKGIEQIALPAAPAEGEDARSVMKIWIGADGAVTKTHLESGNKELGKLLESALPRWRYRKFDYAGQAVEVQT